MNTRERQTPARASKCFPPRGGGFTRNGSLAACSWGKGSASWVCGLFPSLIQFSVSASDLNKIRMQAGRHASPKDRKLRESRFRIISTIDAQIQDKDKLAWP